MRGILVLLLALAGCAKTYEELVPFNCAGDHLCPAPYVCILVNGTGVCHESQPCTLGGTGCASPDRPRCTLMQTALKTASAQCTVQYGTGAEGTECALLVYADEGVFVQGNGLGDHFPGEDRFCNNGPVIV